mgnify:CR=1 FL=1
MQNAPDVLLKHLSVMQDLPILHYGGCRIFMRVLPHTVPMDLEMWTGVFGLFKRMKVAMQTPAMFMLFGMSVTERL